MSFPFMRNERNLMTGKLIVPDYIAGLPLSEYPLKGNENVLLDPDDSGKVKLNTCLEKALPEVAVSELVG